MIIQKYSFLNLWNNQKNSISMKNNSINIILISGSGLLAGLINYIYHPLMLQYMTLEEFWEFGTLAWLFSILSILTTGMTLFLTKEISSHIEDKSHVKNIIFSSTKILWSIGVLLFLVYACITPFIANFLNIKISLLILTGVVILTSFLWTTLSAAVMALKKFEFLGISSITQPLVKLILWWICVYFGMSIFWALFGFLASSIVGLLMSAFYIGYIMKDYSLKWDVRYVLKDFLKSKASILHFLFLSILLSFFTNGDVLLARSIFTPEQTGLYAGISVVWKFLLYTLLSIETVYYGQIMEHRQYKPPMHLVKNSLLFMGVTAFLAIVVNYYIGDFLLSFLSAGLVGHMSLYLGVLTYYSLLAFISIFSKVLIGWWTYLANIFLFVLSFSIFLSVYFFHNDTLLRFISILIWNLVFWVVVLAVLFFFHIFHNKKS